MESELARHMGVPTMFIRVGCSNSFLCLHKKKNFRCPIFSSTEMLYSHVGTSFCTVAFSVNALRCKLRGEQETVCDKELKELRETLSEALMTLAEQVKERWEVYSELRECRSKGAKFFEGGRDPMPLDELMGFCEEFGS